MATFADYMDLFRWAVLSLALIYVVTQSAVFSPVRMLLPRWQLLVTLIYCPACAGFWLGAITTRYWPWSEPLPVLESMAASMVLGAIWSHLFPADVYRAEQEALTHAQAIMSEAAAMAVHAQDILNEPKEPAHDDAAG